MEGREFVIKSTLRLIAAALVIFAIFYLTFAVRDLLFNPYPFWSLLIIVLQLLIEALAFFQSAFMISSMTGSLFKPKAELSRTKPDEYPELDVYVPIRYVDVDILEKTVKALVSQDYPKDRMTIFLADDTPDEQISGSYRALAEKYQVQYIYDPTNVNYKSGMMNIALAKGSSEFVAFFDYDQVPQSGVLTKLAEILFAYPEVPFVQAKKRFTGLYNLSRVWSALLYVIYFEVLQQTKQELRSVLFAGSTACFRRSALEDIGGVPEVTFTEDNELSTVLMLEGKFGLFADFYGSEGTVPNGFRAQISQLWRWSHGGSHVLHAYGKPILRSKEMDLNQKMDTLSMIVITPGLVILYLYVLSFYPLLIAGIDSPRFLIGNVSSLAYMLIGPIFTYLILTSVAIYRVKQDNSEFKFSQIFGFVVIGLTANTLILPSAVLGVIGKMGPKSDKSKWTLPVPVIRISFLASIIGIGLILSSIQFISSGFPSAIILLLTGISLLPALFLSVYYTRKE